MEEENNIHIINVLINMKLLVILEYDCIMIRPCKVLLYA